MKPTRTDYLQAIHALARDLVAWNRARALQRADLYATIAKAMPVDAAAPYQLQADAIKEAAAEQAADEIRVQRKRALLAVAA